MKKSKASEWKSELKNGLKELILLFALLVVGAAVAIFLATLLPKLPVEAIFVLAGVILFIVLGAIALTVYIIKEIKNKN
jgi:hypothetical protein